jgi:drug/metabolite transporter (DMT)-like permease
MAPNPSKLPASDANAAAVRQARTLLFGATLLWGASFPVLRGLQLAQEAAAPRMPDRTLACADMAVRFLVAALFLLPFYARQLGSITPREWSQGVGLGLFAGAGLYLQTLGLAWTDASISAFLTQFYTLLVPLIVAVRDRRAPGARVVTACGMVLLGVALLSPGLLTHFVLGPGEILTLLGTGFLAAQIVWVERPRYASNRPGVVTLIMFTLLGTIFLAAYPFLGGTVSGGVALFNQLPLIALLLLLVVFCTVLNFFIMNAWQPKISATEAGLIYCLEPVIATALSAFVPRWISRFAGISYPNETLRWGLLAGGGLILGATVLVATQRRSSK